MRSTGSEQALLPIGAVEQRSRRRVVRRPAGGPSTTFRIGGELARLRGWPAGTEVRIEPGARPGRGDVVLAIEDARRAAGVYDRRFGREVLVSDRGVRWLGPGVEVLGVVVDAAEPLEGL